MKTADIKEAMPTMETNIGVGQRIISVVSGSALLYDALVNRKSIAEGVAGGYLIFRGATGYCAATDALSKVAQNAKGAMDGSENGSASHSIDIETKVKVARPRNEVYSYWRKLENLPSFMKHLESVTELDERTSEWKARIPGGVGTIDWKAEIKEDQQNERISWQSVKDADIENAGTVQFKDAGKQGTEVKVRISYKAPAGKVGEAVSKLLNPVFENMIKDDIKNFKQQIEHGEMAESDTQNQS